MTLTVQCSIVMHLIAESDYSLQRWRGWIRKVAQWRLYEAPLTPEWYTAEEVTESREHILEDTRRTILNLL